MPAVVGHRMSGMGIFALHSCRIMPAVVGHRVSGMGIIALHSCRIMPAVWGMLFVSTVVRHGIVIMLCVHVGMLMGGLVGFFRVMLCVIFHGFLKLPCN